MGREMNKRRWGRIIHLGSIGVKYGGGKKNFLYSLSKHILEFFPNHTKEWSRNNVLINTIRVGATNTKLHSLLPSKNLKKERNLFQLAEWPSQEKLLNLFIFLDLKKILTLRTKFQLFLAE